MNFKKLRLIDPLKIKTFRFLYQWMGHNEWQRFYITAQITITKYHHREIFNRNKTRQNTLEKEPLNRIFFCFHEHKFSNIRISFTKHTFLNFSNNSLEGRSFIYKTATPRNFIFSQKLIRCILLNHHSFPDIHPSTQRNLENDIMLQFRRDISAILRPPGYYRIDIR